MHTRLVDLPFDREPVLDFLGDAGPGLSENKHAFLELDDGRPGAGLVAESEGGIVGYAGLAPAGEGDWAMETVALPEAVEPLVGAALQEARNRHARRLRWWVYEPAWENQPPQHGFRPERELLVMGRALPAKEAGSLEDFSSTGFRPGVDEEEWLRVNNAAFAGHPENGNLTLSDLERRMAMEWFDPEGVRMAWDGDRLAGFCWTKIHGPREGEIYIIGVDPDFQGRGLGPALVAEGMRHLAAVGCDRVFLYTEGDNTVAIRMYEKLGFAVQGVHRSFLRDLGQ